MQEKSKILKICKVVSVQLNYFLSSKLKYAIKCNLGGNVRKRYFTSESVTEGHPNKVYDQIPDAAFRWVFIQKF